MTPDPSQQLPGKASRGCAVTESSAQNSRGWGMTCKCPESAGILKASRGQVY